MLNVWALSNSFKCEKEASRALWGDREKCTFLARGSHTCALQGRSRGWGWGSTARAGGEVPGRTRQWLVRRRGRPSQPDGRGAATGTADTVIRRKTVFFPRGSVGLPFRVLPRGPAGPRRLLPLT